RQLRAPRRDELRRARPARLARRLLRVLVGVQRPVVEALDAPVLDEVAPRVPARQAVRAGGTAGLEVGLADLPVDAPRAHVRAAPHLDEEGVGLVAVAERRSGACRVGA